MISPIRRIRYFVKVVPGLAAVIGLLLAFFVAAAVGGIREARARNACLERGYPGASVAWGGFGESYCIRRVDQTDEVVPLENL